VTIFRLNSHHRLEAVDSEMNYQDLRDLGHDFPHNMLHIVKFHYETDHRGRDVMVVDCVIIGEKIPQMGTWEDALRCDWCGNEEKDKGELSVKVIHERCYESVINGAGLV